jgi:hypothetical protein
MRRRRVGSEDHVNNGKHPRSWVTALRQPAMVKGTCGQLNLTLVLQNWTEGERDRGQSKQYDLSQNDTLKRSLQFREESNPHCCSQ